jgi:hypothetical protein
MMRQPSTAYERNLARIIRVNARADAQAMILYTVTIELLPPAHGNRDLFPALWHQQSWFFPRFAGARIVNLTYTSLRAWAFCRIDRWRRHTRVGLDNIKAEMVR